MPSDVAIAPNGDIYIADMHHNRVRKVDARTRIITTVAGNGALGLLGRRRPGDRRRRWRARRASRVVPEPSGTRDDLHRRLLQRPRPRGRARRHHPRRQRRRARRVRRADARRVRGRGAAGCTSPIRAATSSWRCTIPRPSRRADRRRAAAAPRRQDGRDDAADEPGRPTRVAAAAGRCRSCGRTAARVSLLSVLLLLRDRARRAAAVAARRSSSTTCSAGASVAGAVRRLADRDHRRQPGRRCSSSSSSPACCCRSSTSSSSAYGTQVQVDTGQRMVYDLRGRLFEHLQALGLHHHITTSTGDAVYRVDVDAYAIENLVMSGIFPLATSIVDAGRDVRRSCCRLDVTVALLSLAVVPFLYLCLRYYTSTLVDREERVKELESKLIERLYETFSRDPAGQELRARAARAAALRDAPASETMNARIAHHLAAVAVLGRRQRDHDPRHRARRRSSAACTCMQRQMTRRRPDRRHRLSRRGLRSAVGDRAHHRTAAGRGRRRQARARDVRADAGDRRRAGRDRRDRRSRATSGSRTSASPIPTARRCCTTSASRPSPARWSRWSASPAPARRRWSA